MHVSASVEIAQVDGFIAYHWKNPGHDIFLMYVSRFVSRTISLLDAQKNTSCQNTGG